VHIYIYISQLFVPNCVGCYGLFVDNFLEALWQKKSHGEFLCARNGGTCE
jgi:hypothetical protein